MEAGFEEVEGENQFGGEALKGVEPARPAIEDEALGQEGVEEDEELPSWMQEGWSPQPRSHW